MRATKAAAAATMTTSRIHSQALLLDFLSAVVLASVFVVEPVVAFLASPEVVLASLTSLEAAGVLLVPVLVVLALALPVVAALVVPVVAAVEPLFELVLPAELDEPEPVLEPPPLLGLEGVVVTGALMV